MTEAGIRPSIEASQRARYLAPDCPELCYAPRMSEELPSSIGESIDEALLCRMPPDLLDHYQECKRRHRAELKDIERLAHRANLFLRRWAGAARQDRILDFFPRNLKLRGVAHRRRPCLSRGLGGNGHLVCDTGQAFLAPQQCQDIENAR